MLVSSRMNFLKRISLIYWLVAVVSVVAVAFAAILPLMSTDTACRYAPMAEAFAQGDWLESFHPRFGVGMQVISGCLVFLTPMDGYAACAVSSVLAWALCIIPVYYIADRVFGRTAAWASVLLYLVCPQPLMWGLKGLREPFKMLGILMAVDSLIGLVRDERYVVVKAVLALMLLILFKVDAVILAFLMVLAFLILDHLGRRSLLIAGISLIVLQPMCWLVFYWHGWWVPAPQYISIIHRVMGALGIGGM